MFLSIQHFPDDQRLFSAIGDDREMQWRNLGNGKDEIVVSAVISSCSCLQCFSFFLRPFGNQVLTINCCVAFQSLSLTIEGPSIILDVLRLWFWCIC